MPSMIIGGVAASVLGQPRLTQDVDVLAILPEADWTHAVSAVSGARTALMFAALSGSGEATATLLAHGARLHQTDAEGQEAAQYARGEAVLLALYNVLQCPRNGPLA
jgi:hypothetical protein